MASLKEMMELVTIPNKVVKVKVIKRRKAYFSVGHDGEDVYTGCNKKVGLPYNVGKRAYVNPFTPERMVEEQEAFETLLNQKKGSLNLYSYSTEHSNFWGDFLISIPKEGVELHLDSPKDALMYKVLKANPMVAKNKKETALLSKEFVIIDADEENKSISTSNKKKNKALDYLYSIKKSKKKLVETLKLLGKKVSMTDDKEWLVGEILTIIEEPSFNKGKGIINIDNFINIMEDSARDIKLFVIEAIENKEIIRDINGYKLADTNKLIGKNHEEVIKYFLSTDPKIKELILIIKDRIKNASK